MAYFILISWKSVAGNQLLLQVEKLPKGTWELCYRALFSENLAYYSFFLYLLILEFWLFILICSVLKHLYPQASI